jgi:O-antigen ligase
MLQKMRRKTMFWNTGITRSNTNKLLLICAIMLSTMLLPSFEIKSSIPRIRLDDVLIFGAFGINLIAGLFSGFRSSSDAELGLSYQEDQNRALKAVNKVFLLFLGSMVISNLYAVIFLKMPFGLRDLMEGVTLAKYYLAVTLAVSLDLQDTEFNTLRNVFLVGLAICMVLSWSQFLNIFKVNAWLTPFFARSHLDNLVHANPPRVLGTFDNPNVMGIFSVFAMTLLAAWYYFRKGNRRYTLLMLVVTGLTIKLTFLTISRTALLATALTLTVLSLWSLFRFHWRKDILLKVAALFVVTIFIFVTSPRGFTMRLNDATDLQTSTSAQGHFLRAGNAFQLIKQSPILGWGTAKTTMTTLVDDEYALITRRYGIVGLAAYLWFFIRPVKGALSKIKLFDFEASEARIRKRKILLGIAFTAATLAAFVYNITAGIFYNLQLMTFFALFMGLIYRTEGELD